MEILECVVFFWVLSVLTGSLLGCTHAELCLSVFCSSWYLGSDLGALSCCFFRHVFWVFSISDYFCDQPKFGTDFHIDIGLTLFATPMNSSFSLTFLVPLTSHSCPITPDAKGASTFLPLESWECWPAPWVRIPQHHSSYGSSSSL